MKFASALFLMMLPLAGCFPAPGKIDAAAVRKIAPDVPPVDLETQKKAAAEMKGGQCPALNTLANVCLVSRDQSRALQNFK
jgi:hypothetical protein